MKYPLDLLNELSIIEFPILINEPNETAKVLKEKLDGYINIINKYKTNIGADICTSIEETREMLVKIHSCFLNGYFLEAYQFADKVIANQLELNIISSKIDIVDYNSYYYKFFYRSRTGDSKSNFKKDDMFNIPIEKRFIVGSQRFSAPGVPCLYLGSSSYVCWLEAGRPAENTFYVSAFYPLDDLHILDLTLTPLSFNEYSFLEIQNDEISIPAAKRQVEIKKRILKESSERLKKFLITYPITLACGIKVTDVEERYRSFKEEYIIPQLILQSLARNKIDGVSYLSTYLGKNDAINIFTNYAFPIKPESENLLTTKFCVSSPVTLAEARNISNSRNRQYIMDCFIEHSTFKAHTMLKSRGKNSRISIADGSLGFGYNSTDFFIIDDELKKSMLSSIEKCK